MIKSSSPLFNIEKEHVEAFENYWKKHGVNVRTEIHAVPMGDYTAYSMSSDLVLHVPKKLHKKVYGRDGCEIKSRLKRKWA